MDHHPAQNSPLRRLELTGSRLSPRLISGLTILLLLWTGLYAGIFLYHGTQLVLYPYDVDNSEAYLVYQGQRLAQGKGLYRPIEQMPFLVDNYPPAYPALLALGYKIGGVNFHWPRLLSFAASILTAALIGLWVWRLTQDRISAFFSTLAYLSFYHVYDWGALARVDAVGVCFAVLALVLFHRTRSWKTALPLLLFALFTRQTLFAAPLAIFFALFFANRRPAFLFAASLIGAGFLILSVLALLTSGGALTHLVLYNANEFRPFDIWVYFRHWTILYPVWGCIPALMLLLLPYKAEAEDLGLPLLFWFTLFAIGEALLCGKIGSAPNYLLTLVCATCVGLGVVLSQLREMARQSERPVYSLPYALFLLASFFQLLGNWHWPHSHADWSLTPSRELAYQGATVQRLLAQTPGPALTDRAGAALMAGHPPVFEPFICTQLARQGLWDQTMLLEPIRKKEFPVVALQFDLSAPKWDTERFTVEMIDALRENYSLANQVGMYFIYKPKL